MIFLLLVVIKLQLALNGEQHIFEVAVFTMDICIKLMNVRNVGIWFPGYCLLSCESGKLYKLYIFIHNPRNFIFYYYALFIVSICVNNKPSRVLYLFFTFGFRASRAPTEIFPGGGGRCILYILYIYIKT